MASESYRHVFSTSEPAPPPPPEGILTEEIPEFIPPEVSVDSRESVLRLLPADFRTYYPPGRWEYYRLRTDRALLIWIIRQILKTWTPPPTP